MRTKILSLTIMISSLLSLGAAVSAADADLPVLETKVKTAALFKNGLGFVIREGSTPLKEGWAVTRHVPDAILGGIWFGCLDRDGRLDEVVGFKADRSEKIEAISPDELLKANIGKRVVLHFDDKTLTGRVKAVPDNRIPEYDASVYSYGGYAPPVEYSAVVVLETAQGDVAVNKNVITRVEFPDGMSTQFDRKQETRNLKFRVSGPRSAARIGMSYLEKGISWTPGYLVQIETDNKAQITMQATVVNDAEDLEGAELFFVVGYPNFIYANVLSPMAMRQSITDFISALSSGDTRGAGYGAMANVMAQSYAPAAADESGIASYNYSAVPGLEGGYEEDLFLYNKQGVNLKKNERASYLVFSDRVDYKHVYEWEIPDLSGGDYDNGDESTREQVWHSLRLTNSTQYPWTTAPAIAVRESKPMAQDMITYTPKGGKVNLKLTVASDVKTDRQEYETDRQRDVSLYGYSYDLVTVKGELVVKNNKSSAITLDIRKHITGEVLAQSHDGKVKKLAEGISRRRANGNSVIAWEVPVAAGVEVKLAYSYKIYVSN